jgi:hypothetical protein
MTRTTILVMACIVSLMMGSPAFGAAADKLASDPAVVKDIGNHLSIFEERAAQVSIDAGQLWTLTRNHAAWQSHAHYLNNLREDVNDMGEMLAELETMKPGASEAQRLAIERVRPHLAALAQKTTEALDLARSGSRNLKHTAYKDTLAGLYEQAHVLYQTLEILGDYHDANEQFEKLESSHGGSIS